MIKKGMLSHFAHLPLTVWHHTETNPAWKWTCEIAPIGSLINVSFTSALIASRQLYALGLQGFSHLMKPVSLASCCIWLIFAYANSKCIFSDVTLGEPVARGLLWSHLILIVRTCILLKLWVAKRLLSAVQSHLQGRFHCYNYFVIVPGQMSESEANGSLSA